MLVFPHEQRRQGQHGFCEGAHHVPDGLLKKLEEIDDVQWNGVHGDHVQIVLMMTTGCEKRLKTVNVKVVMLM